MDDRHYTDGQIKRMINSNAALDDAFLDHIAVCDDCRERFLRLSDEIEITPQRNVSFNIIERIRIQRQRIKDFFYNMRVCFGVVIAILMLFNIPTDAKMQRPFERADKNMAVISEMKDEFDDEFYRITEDMKGIFENDKKER